MDALAKLATVPQEDLDRWDSVEHLMEPFSRRQQRRGPSNNDRAELDGSHLGLPIERDISKQSEGSI